MQPSAPAPVLVTLALIAIQVLFGINYVVSKIVVTAFPPLVWASIRIIISSALMAGVAFLFRRDKHPKIGRAFFVPLIAFALLGSIINQGSFLVGLSYTTATNSAILNTLIPVFTLLVVTVRGQEPLTLKRSLGFFAAFFGVLVLRKVENFTLSDHTLIGDLLTVLNCFSYALFLSYSKKFMEQNDRVWTTVYLFAYGSVGLTLIALPSYTTFHWPAMSPALLGAMTFAVIGGTLLTYFLNVWTLAYAKSSSVAFFIYLQPVITSIVAWIFFGETLTLRTGLAYGLILAGMLLALQRKPAIVSQKESAAPVPLDLVK